MSQSYDAIVIGAGIIGACTAFELAKRGWRTLNVDKLPAASYGSTGSSCAIIRTHYSTLDGSALAYEAFFDWDDWANYLGVADERGLAAFHKTGCLVMRTAANGHLRSVCAHQDTLGIPWEDWAPERIAARFPFYDLRAFGPPKRPDDPAFGEAHGAANLGAVFFPCAGYISDPQLAAHNAQRAAEAEGADVPLQRRSGGDTARGWPVRRRDGSSQARRSTRRSWSTLPARTRTRSTAWRGRGRHDHHDAQRPAQELAHVPFLAGFDFERMGLATSDPGRRLLPAGLEIGNHLLIGSEDPPRYVRGVDPDDYDCNFSEQWQVQVQRVAKRIPGLPVTSPVRGVVDLYDVTEDWIPIYDKSDLAGFYMAVGTAAISSRTRPWSAREGRADHRPRTGPRPRPRPARLPPPAHRATLNLGFFSRRRTSTLRAASRCWGVRRNFDAPA